MALIIDEKKKKVVNTEDVEFLEELREYLSSIRNENFNQYKSDTRLKYQSFSNVIGLLEELKNNKENL